MTEFTHRPVLLDECIENLKTGPTASTSTEPWAGRATSREIAKRLTTGRLICIDRDQAALDAAPARLGSGWTG